MDVKESLKLYQALCLHFGKDYLSSTFVSEMDAFIENIVQNSHNSLQSDCLPYLLPLYPINSDSQDHQENVQNLILKLLRQKNFSSQTFSLSLTQFHE